MKNNFLYLIITVCFSLILFSSCKKDDTTGPVNTNSFVVIDLSNNAVVGDTVTLSVKLQNKDAVTKVDYYREGTLINSSTNPADNFKFIWILTNPVLGAEYKIYAVATDKENKTVVSDTITLHYQWRLLMTDTNEPWLKNIHQVFVRSSETKLEFRVVVHGMWGDPFNINEGISCGIYIDTDQNPNTGLKPVANFFPYKVNDIGPDYMLLAGFEDSRLFRWNDADTSWKIKSDLNYLNMPNSINTFELGINRSEIGNPNKVDIVVMNISLNDSGEAKWDWAPDAGHVTYTVDGKYLGKKTVFKYNPIPVLKPGKTFLLGK